MTEAKKTIALGLATQAKNPAQKVALSDARALPCTPDRIALKDWYAMYRMNIPPEICRNGRMWDDNATRAVRLLAAIVI